MIDRTGILNNPPLTHVLASIRFAPWTMLAKRVDEIHDELREFLPLIQMLRIRRSVPSGHATEDFQESNAWMLMPIDRTFVVQLATNQLVVFCKGYSRYTDFEAKTSKVLEVLEKYMKFMHVENMGIRYIDLVKTEQGEALDDYVNPEFLAPKISGFEREDAAVISIYTYDGAKIRIRCITDISAPVVPDELIPLEAMSRIDITKPLTIARIQKGQALFDIDSFLVKPNPEKMQKENVLDELNKLHRNANKIFRHEAVFTDKAFGFWKNGG